MDRRNFLKASALLAGKFLLNPNIISGQERLIPKEAEVLVSESFETILAELSFVEPNRIALKQNIFQLTSTWLDQLNHGEVHLKTENVTISTTKSPSSNASTQELFNTPIDDSDDFKLQLINYPMIPNQQPISIPEGIVTETISLGIPNLNAAPYFKYEVKKKLSDSQSTPRQIQVSGSSLDAFYTSLTFLKLNALTSTLKNHTLTLSNGNSVGVVINYEDVNMPFAYARLLMNNEQSFPSNFRRNMILYYLELMGYNSQRQLDRSTNV